MGHLSRTPPLSYSYESIALEESHGPKPSSGKRGPLETHASGSVDRSPLLAYHRSSLRFIRPVFTHVRTNDFIRVPQVFEPQMREYPRQIFVLAHLVRNLTSLQHCFLKLLGHAEIARDGLSPLSYIDRNKDDLCSVASEERTPTYTLLKQTSRLPFL